MGATVNNYHFEYLLNSIITQDTLDYTVSGIPMMVGGGALRKVFTDEEVFKSVGFGFHLIIPRPSSIPKQTLDCYKSREYKSNK